MGGYLWIGCFSVGGNFQDGEEAWNTIGRISGIVGWLVAVGNLAISCCSDRNERFDEKEVYGAPPTTSSRGDDVERPSCASTYGASSTGVPMYDPTRDSSMSGVTNGTVRDSAVSQGSSALAPTAGTEASGNPAEGQTWNTAATKPFGS